MGVSSSCSIVCIPGEHSRLPTVTSMFCGKGVLYAVVLVTSYPEWARDIWSLVDGYGNLELVHTVYWAIIYILLNSCPSYRQSRPGGEHTFVLRCIISSISKQKFDIQ